MHGTEHMVGLRHNQLAALRSTLFPEKRPGHLKALKDQPAETASKIPTLSGDQQIIPHGAY